MSEQRLQDGGTLREDALYVVRSADRQIQDALRQGEYCYVLAPRQIGKSSLCARARGFLQDLGVRCVSIDLTGNGAKNSKPTEWYFGLIYEIALQLDLDDPFPNWQSREALSPVHRFSCFLADLLTSIQDTIVIFIDEIDTTLSLDHVSRDDFFAAIRSCYNARVDRPEFNRLAFCLIGVALPDELIGDEARTPFNIGQGIPLEDFSAQEMRSFLLSLRGVGGDPSLLLDSIFSWTGGHPYMTQRVCKELRAQEGTVREDPEEGRVKEVVTRLYLSQPPEDTCLAFVEKSFRKDAPDVLLASQLSVYRRILSGERIAADSRDRLQRALRIAGLVSIWQEKDGTYLHVRNAVFSKVFDARWATSKQSNRILFENVTKWIENERSAEYLLTGPRLQSTQDFAVRVGSDSLDKVELEFLNASLALTASQVSQQRLIIAGLSVTILGLFFAGGVAGAYYRRAKNAQKIAEETTSAFKSEAKKAQASASEAKKQEEAAAANLKKAQEQKDQAQKNEREAQTQEKAAAANLKKATESLCRIAQAEAGREAEDLAKSSVNINRAIQRSLKASLPNPTQPQPEEQLYTSACKDRAGRPLNHLPPQARQGLASTAAATAGWQTSGQRIHSGLQDIVFSSDAKYLASRPSNDPAEVLALYQIGNPTPLHRREFKGLRKYAFLEGLPDSEPMLVVSTLDGLYSWNPQADPVERLSKSPLTSTSLRLLASNRMTYVATSEGMLTVLNRAVEQWKPLPLQAPIRSMALYQDTSQRERLLTTGSDWIARIWNPETEYEESHLIGHTGAVTDGAFSASGKYVITASKDRSARIWNVAGPNPTHVHTLWGHQGGVKSVAVWESPSAKGGLVATVGEDELAMVWSLESGQRMQILQGQTDDGGVLRATFEPQGRFIYSASEKGVVRKWDLEKQRPLSILAGHKGSMRAALFISTPRPMLLTGGDDNLIRVWNPDKGTLEKTLAGHKYPVVSLDLSADGKFLLSRDDPGTVLLFSFSEILQGTQRLPQVLCNSCQRASFSGDGQGVYLEKRIDSAIEPSIWHFASDQKTYLSQESRYVRAAALAPDGRTLFVLPSVDTPDSSPALWDLHRGTHKRQISLPPEVQILDATWVGSDLLLFGRRFVWLLPSGGPSYIQGPAVQGKFPFTKAEVSTDRSVILLHSTQAIALWRPKKKIAPILIRGEYQQTHLAPDGRHLSVIDSAGFLRVFSTEPPAPGNQPESLFQFGTAATAGFVETAAFSTDSRKLLVAFADQSVRLYPASLDSALDIICSALRK